MEFEKSKKTSYPQIRNSSDSRNRHHALAALWRAFQPIQPRFSVKDKIQLSKGNESSYGRFLTIEDTWNLVKPYDEICPFQPHCWSRILVDASLGVHCRNFSLYSQLLSFLRCQYPHLSGVSFKLENSWTYPLKVHRNSSTWRLGNHH